MFRERINDSWEAATVVSAATRDVDMTTGQRLNLVVRMDGGIALFWIDTVDGSLLEQLLTLGHADRQAILYRQRVGGAWGETGVLTVRGAVEVESPVAFEDSAGNVRLWMFTSGNGSRTASGIRSAVLSGGTLRLQGDPVPCPNTGKALYGQVEVTRDREGAAIFGCEVAYEGMDLSLLLDDGPRVIGSGVGYFRTIPGIPGAVLMQGSEIRSGTEYANLYLADEDGGTRLARRVARGGFGIASLGFHDYLAGFVSRDDDGVAVRVRRIHPEDQPGPGPDRSH